jgi:hypothetical protein
MTWYWHDDGTMRSWPPPSREVPPQPWQAPAAVYWHGQLPGSAAISRDSAGAWLTAEVTYWHDASPPERSWRVHRQLPGYQPGLGMPPGPEWPDPVLLQVARSWGMHAPGEYRIEARQDPAWPHEVHVTVHHYAPRCGHHWPVPPVQPPARPEPESLAQRFLPPRWLVTAWMILLLLTGEAFLAVLLAAALRAVAS